MRKAKLLLDTNVVIDYLNRREPHYEKTRLLMIAGRVAEFELWITSSQVADLIYILSEGGSRSLLPRVIEQLKGLRTFVNVYSVGDREVDLMLAAPWKDPEDSLLFESALRMKADAIITRNQADFETSVIKVVDCNEFFSWMKNEFGLDYAEAQHEYTEKRASAHNEKEERLRRRKELFQKLESLPPFEVPEGFPSAAEIVREGRDSR